MAAKEPSVKCPKCGHRLGFYPEFRFWKCTNCGKICTYDELREVSAKGEGKVEQRKPKKSRRILKIVGITLAYVLAIVILIVAVGPFSFIPLWLLLGISVIYSIERWLTYYTRRYKIVGWIYRLILNLSVLSLLGLLISSGVLLFTQQFMQSPLIGSLVFVLELAVFVWLCRVISKNSWRQPSMKLTVVSLICLFIIFSFAGVQPMANYKDVAIDKIRMIWPEHPTSLTIILVLVAIGFIILLVDTIRQRRSPLRIVLTVIAVITTFLALLGLFYYISPTLFIKLMSFLPASIQDAMFIDFLLRGTGFWIFAIVSGILWYVISIIR